MNLGYVYNGDDSDEVYSPLGLVPPAGGYVIVNGTSYRTGNPADSAIVDLQWRRGHRYFYNVPMTRFWSFWDNATIEDPEFGVYKGSLQMYNLFRGAVPNPGYPDFIPLYEVYPPPFSRPSNYVFSGNPVTHWGFIDGPRGTRRIMLIHGPIEMNKNDTVEIVVATVGAEGVNYISGVSILQLYAKYAQSVFTWSAKPSTITEVKQATRLPSRFELAQNYPNPFNPSTSISYQLTVNSYVTLKVYDMLGRELTTLVSGNQSIGYHTVRFNAGNLPSGVYFYRLQAGTYGETKKLLLLK